MALASVQVFCALHITVHETRSREMGQVMDFFEEMAVPDKERILDGWSDTVWQPETNADIIYRESGEQLIRIDCATVDVAAHAARQHPSAWVWHGIREGGVLRCPGCTPNSCLVME